MATRVREIQAKTLLGTVKQPDTWFGLRYNLNLYRGCQHQCIYCDTRSECYGIEDFDHEVLVKANALELLERELSRKRVKGTIGLGSMNDPYMPLEAERQLTRGALAIIARHRFPLHVITKSDLILRDLDHLKVIAETYAAVSFTVTCADDALSLRLEPGAPPSSRRFAAISALAREGIRAGVTLMPVLPFLEDTEENLRAIALAAKESGAAYILPAFGMTMRDRQRAHFYARLDEHFPGLREKYERRYGDRYECPVPQAGCLEAFFRGLCGELGIPDRIEPYRPGGAEQLPLF
jgi:DNA repair photolyase